MMNKTQRHLDAPEGEDDKVNNPAVIFINFIFCFLLIFFCDSDMKELDQCFLYVHTVLWRCL